MGNSKEKVEPDGGDNGAKENQEKGNVKEEEEVDVSVESGGKAKDNQGSKPICPLSTSISSTIGLPTVPPLFAIYHHHPETGTTKICKRDEEDCVLT